MKIEGIKTEEPFKSLFPIEREVLDRVQEDMREHGYDPSQPIVLWTDTKLQSSGGTGFPACAGAG